MMQSIGRYIAVGSARGLVLFFVFQVCSIKNMWRASEINM